MIQQTLLTTNLIIHINKSMRMAQSPQKTFIV